MHFRHEWKHVINFSDMMIIRQRLSAVAQPDAHAVDGRYIIRSLYFDNLADKALREKIDGHNFKEKFRLRFYNYDDSLIHLEKKSKRNNLCNKQKAAITAAETRALIAGDVDFMLDCDRPLLRELYCKMRLQGLRPRTIVDYIREPFVYAPGNVRVTLDHHLRTGLNCIDFLDPHCLTIPAAQAPILLEVKWDEYLPDIIRDAVQLDSRRVGAFSKYAACRIYG
ncbi:MAG: polyphosphate polymerase domain-containing protein [Bacillota bacterium]|nr:polyphosphate polymerase domain-containing protein [Bacillota bacterium]